VPDCVAIGKAPAARFARNPSVVPPYRFKPSYSNRGRAPTRALFLVLSCRILGISISSRGRKNDFRRCLTYRVNRLPLPLLFLLDDAAQTSKREVKGEQDGLLSHSIPGWSFARAHGSNSNLTSGTITWAGHRYNLLWGFAK